jgi:dTDP-4-dehydrorhamnose 3,5-epimerase
MIASALAIPDVIMFAPKVFQDERGLFFESFNAAAFSEATGSHASFVQDNFSRSARGVLRGMHYQVMHPQGKFVRVTSGEVFDVAVDIRLGSPTFGKWVGERLSANNGKALWIPEGFAHGFLVLSETADFQYKVTDYWYPEHERCLRFDDPDVAIAWPAILSQATTVISPILSEKDIQGMALNALELF